LIDLTEIHPDDRVLILFIPDGAVIRDIAGQLTSGVLVGIGHPDQVAEARRACADCSNVMLIHEDPVGLIPWQDGYFTLVISPANLAAGGETRRVLVPNGRILIANV
jgi:hypothetical protein